MGISYKDSKKTQLVKHWLYNLKNNKENEEVLLVLSNIINKSFMDTFKDTINKNLFENTNNQLEYNILTVEEFLKNKEHNSTRNTILVANNKIQLASLKNIQKKILVLCLEQNTCKKIDDFFLPYSDIDKYLMKYEVTDDEHYLYYIEQRKPFEIVRKFPHILEQFIFNSFGDNGCIIEASINTLSKDTNLSNNNVELIDPKVIIARADKTSKHRVPSNNLIIENSVTEEYLKRDIAILNEKAILTSRLSIIIYRKAQLDIKANITEIGRYFSQVQNKAFINKSKVVDLKKICKGSSVNYDGLSKTKVKAYDLNIKSKSEKEIRNELEKEIRGNIARKLLYFTDIDIDTIERIVELPKSTIQKYK